MGKQLSNSVRHAIVILYNLNWSISKIASNLNISKEAVSLWVSRYKENKIIEEKNKSGRPRKTTSIEDKKIIDIVLNSNVIMTSDDIVNQLNTENINISKNTVINRLTEKSLIYGKTIKKPLLTNNHKQLRLMWAIENYNTDWTKIKFSDETIIRKYFNTKQWMLKNTRKIEQTVSHPIKILLWGYISFEGVGKLCCFNGIMNADKYINILDNYFKPYITNDSYFQFDNDSKHTSLKASNYLFNNNIKCIRWWPPNSPDLNPIEHIWAYIKNKLRKKIIRTIKELEENIKNIWENIPYSIIYNLICSMPQRIEQVIQNGGGHTNY